MWDKTYASSGIAKGLNPQIGNLHDSVCLIQVLKSYKIWVCTKKCRLCCHKIGWNSGYLDVMVTGNPILKAAIHQEWNLSVFLIKLKHLKFHAFQYTGMTDYPG